MTIPPGRSRRVFFVGPWYGICLSARDLGDLEPAEVAHPGGILDMTFEH